MAMPEGKHLTLVDDRSVMPKTQRHQKMKLPFYCAACDSFCDAKTEYKWRNMEQHCGYNSHLDAVEAYEMAHADKSVEDCHHHYHHLT
eukprot:6715128-Karenia_brevis.AAC.1